MCTVAFIPLPDRTLLISLRDESPLRARALPPKIFSEGGIDHLYPIDSEGGGTWIGVNHFGTMVVLLNGGFEKHQRQPYYAGSRGQIVKKMLEGKQSVTTWTEMDLVGKEAHTLIVFENNLLYHLVWDEQHQHITKKDPARASVWSSSTLYDSRAGSIRNQELLNRINESWQLDRLDLLGFFRSYGDLENGFFMNRNERVKTLSMSYLVHTGKKIEFNYHELNSDQLHFAEIEIINTGHD